jgi:hypothetical protein
VHELRDPGDRLGCGRLCVLVIACDKDSGVPTSDGQRSRDVDNGVRASDGLRSCDEDNGVRASKVCRSLRSPVVFVVETGWDA